MDLVMVLLVRDLVAHVGKYQVCYGVVTCHKCAGDGKSEMVYCLKMQLLH